MKALFIPFAPSLAHVSRCLALAEAWRGRGHVAVFAVGDERMSMVGAAGFDVRRVPEVPGAVFRADRGWRWLTAEHFARCLDAERAILASVQPDLVVFDFRHTAGLSARLAGRPSVAIVHGNALRLALHPQAAAQLMVGEAGALRGAAGLRLRVMRRMFPVVFPLILRVIAHRATPALRARGFAPFASPFQLLLGDENIIADIPSFLPAEAPPRSHIAGPLMWSGWEQPAPWLDELDARPIVYVTMGSTVEAGSTLARLVAALRSGPYNVVIAAPNAAVFTGLQSPRIRAFPTVPGATVARQCGLVIHHGGHETLMQALAAGVPSLVIPFNPDQVLIAQQVEALGIGRSLWRPTGLPLGKTTLAEMTALRLRRVVDDLLIDERYRRACAGLQGEIAAQGGADGAARWLETVGR